MATAAIATIQGQRAVERAVQSRRHSCRTAWLGDDLRVLEHPEHRVDDLRILHGDHASTKAFTCAKVKSPGRTGIRPSATLSVLASVTG